MISALTEIQCKVPHCLTRGLGVECSLVVLAHQQKFAHCRLCQAYKSQVIVCPMKPATGKRCLCCEFPSCVVIPFPLCHWFQGNIPFSVSRLFGWQRTNRLYTQGDGGGEGDGALELPHFSSPSLVAKHSHEERLPYVFFLKQGLPSFAYANFMVSKGVTKKNFSRK